MANFSAGEAIASGFRVVRRKPVAVLWWAGAYLLFYAAPYVLLMWAVLPDLLGFYQGAARNAGAVDTEQMMALQSRMMTVQPLLWLLSLAVMSVLVGAMFRAELEPENDRFGYLRLGRQELWFGLTALTLLLFCMVMVIAVAIPIGIGAGFAAATGGRSAIAGLAILLLVLAGGVAVTWVLLRLSMALPMSFAQGRFVLFESWDFTRGHALKLFGVAVAVMVLAAVIQAVIAGLFFGAAIALAGGWRALLVGSPEELLQRYAPYLVVAAILGSVVAMAIYAVMVAPWANIYRQLTADDIPV